MGDPSMTVDGLISMLTEQYGVELSMLSSGVTILFSDFLDRKKMKVNTLTGNSLCMYVCMYVCINDDNWLCMHRPGTTRNDH